MASGKKHALASLVVAVPTGLATGLVFGPVAGAGAVAGCLAGIVLTPDLDLLEAQMPWWKEVLVVVVWIVFIAAVIARAIRVF